MYLYKICGYFARKEWMFMIKRLVIVLFFLLSLGMTSVAYMEAQAQGEQPAKKIVVNIPNRSLSLYVDGKRAYLFPVGIGRPTTKTPVGEYTILSKEVNPSWIKPEDTSVVIESGPENPLGYRWMQIKGAYGIHGTNQPASVGGYVSNGCIRMKEPDVEVLYDLVPVGTPVEIIYSRLVIEKDPAKVITYYIYPDVYNYEPLDVAKVNAALAAFGMSAFVSDEDIAKKIQTANGQPTYIARAVKLAVNDEKIPEMGAASNRVYLPAEAVAKQLKIQLNWDANKGVVSSLYGEAPGYLKKNVLYIDAMDAKKLLHVELDWQNPELLQLVSMGTDKVSEPLPVKAEAPLLVNAKKKK